MLYLSFLSNVPTAMAPLFFLLSLRNHVFFSLSIGELKKEVKKNLEFEPKKKLVTRKQIIINPHGPKLVADYVIDEMED